MYQFTFLHKNRNKMYHTSLENILLHLCTINNKPCTYEEKGEYDVTLIFRYLAIIKFQDIYLPVVMLSFIHVYSNSLIWLRIRNKKHLHFVHVFCRLPQATEYT